MSGWPGWRHVVALWVVLHVASTCVSAVPDPRFAMKKELWKDPRVQREFDAWAETLGVEAASFESSLWRFGEWASRVHAALDAPFVPYLRLSGNRQRWPMFGAGAAESDRYEVRARSCTTDDDGRCAWTLLYRTGDNRARMLASELEAPRVRSQVSSASYQGRGAARRRMCRAIAHRVLAARADLKDVVEVECSFMRTTAPAPRRGAPPPAAEQRGRAVRVSRDDVAPEGRP